MEWLPLAGGVLLIFTGIADIFLTVLHPGGFGFLSSRFYKKLFHSVRLLTRPMPRKFWASGLSMAAPLMIPLIITIWIAWCSWATLSSTMPG